MSDVLQGPSGNYYDKFNSKNPIARWLMDGFKNSFLELYSRTMTDNILEVGCGEGHILELMSQRENTTIHGFDVDIPILQEAIRRCPQVSLSMTDAHYFSYPNHAFDLVVACEVLEHVRDPDQVLQEAKRVSRRYGIFSVPHEPVWRVLNILRGKYVTEFGNTPGHIQHWNHDEFVALVSAHFNVIEVRQPLPWIMILAETRD